MPDPTYGTTHERDEFEAEWRRLMRIAADNRFVVLSQNIFDITLFLSLCFWDAFLVFALF